jgi:hypothetical protein
MSVEWYGEPGGPPVSLKGMRRTLAGICMLVIAAGCSPTADPRSSVPRVPSPDASGTVTVPLLEPRDPVFVYLLRKDAGGYRRAGYDALPRPSRGARGAGERIQVALDELARGTTRAERHNGYASAFSRDTADVVLRAELRGRRVVVDFRDFRRDQGAWSTSYGGSIFLTQLSETIFRFERVRSVLFRIERDCARFWRFLQAGGCEVVHRGGDRTAKP